MVSPKDNDPVKVPSMKLDVEDRRQQAKPTGSIGARRKPAAATTKASTAAKGTVRAKPSPLATMVASVALLGVVAVGVLSYLQHQKITELTSVIAELQIAQADVGSQIETAVLEAQEDREFAQSEIRKLWGVAYDRNRAAIAANTTAIARMESTLANASSQARRAAETAGQSGSAVERLQAELASKEIAASEANQRALLLGEVIEEQQRSMQNMADQIADLERRNAISEEALSKRINETEELINGFNAYRQSVNRQLLELRNQINSGQ